MKWILVERNTTGNAIYYTNDYESDNVTADPSKATIFDTRNGALAELIFIDIDAEENKEFEIFAIGKNDK